jgi:hypothetical protein
LTGRSGLSGCVCLSMGGVSTLTWATRDGKRWKSPPEGGRWWPTRRFASGGGGVCCPCHIPSGGGSINELRPFLDVASDSDFNLNVAFLLVAMRPRGPYPIKVDNGEQGSAKTTAGRVLGALIDPCTSPLRSPPREVRDLMIAATNSWLLGYDNLSDIPEWLSDCFCRLSTGDGFRTRELYTDREETIFEAIRPLILNGIGSLVARGDLADRSLIFNLPQILDDERLSEKAFWERFKAARPRIQGALLDAVSTTLRNQDSVQIRSLPRMADFALWVVAAEPALPWPPGSFLAAYTSNRQEAVELSLEAHVVAVAVRAHMVGRDEWTATPTELYETLKEFVPEITQKSKAWPKAAHRLSNRLKRAATFLKAVGIEVEFSHSTDRKIRLIRKSMQSSVRSVRSVQAQEYQGPSSDASQNCSVLRSASSVRKTNTDEVPDASTDGKDAFQNVASAEKADNHAAMDGEDASDAILPNLSDDQLREFPI